MQVHAGSLPALGAAVGVATGSARYVQAKFIQWAMSLEESSTH